MSLHIYKAATLLFIVSNPIPFSTISFSSWAFFDNTLGGYLALLQERANPFSFVRLLSISGLYYVTSKAIRRISSLTDIADSSFIAQSIYKRESSIASLSNYLLISINRSGRTIKLLGQSLVVNLLTLIQKVFYIPPAVVNVILGHHSLLPLLDPLQWLASVGPYYPPCPYRRRESGYNQAQRQPSESFRLDLEVIQLKCGWFLSLTDSSLPGLTAPGWPIKFSRNNLASKPNNHYLSGVQHRDTR